MQTKDKIFEFIKNNKKVNVNDLLNELNISRAMIHRHLLKLQNEGLIVKSGKPPIVFYSLNHPTTQKSEAERISNILVEKYKPEKVILFGSVARGEETKESDLDLFLVKDTDKNYFDRVSEAEKFIKTDKEVDLIIYTPHEFDKAVKDNLIFINQILKYGKTLYDAKYLQ